MFPSLPNQLGALRHTCGWGPTPIGRSERPKRWVGRSVEGETYRLHHFTLTSPGEGASPSGDEGVVRSRVEQWC